MRGGQKLIFNKPKKKTSSSVVAHFDGVCVMIAQYYYIIGNNYAKCATVPRSVHGPARLQVLPPPRKRRVESRLVAPLFFMGKF